MCETLSHLDESGTAKMVDVSAKNETKRMARAEGFVAMGAETRRLVAEKAVPKGDVFTVARIAGIQAAKRTGEWIPLCHPLPLSGVTVDLTLTDTGVYIEASATCVGRTGVEMEALVAVSAAALTVYDMCKSADKGMVIGPTRLLQKTGGKSGEWRARDLPPPAPLSSEERGELGGGNAALARNLSSSGLPPLLRGEGGGGGEV